MTPAELDEFAANFSGLADVGRVVAALKEAWAEVETQKQSVFFATASARMMQAERDVLKAEVERLRAERDGLSATLQAREDAQIQDRVTFRKELASQREMHVRAESHCPRAEDTARIALAERDARPDAATVEKVRAKIEAAQRHHTGRHGYELADDLREALRLLERK